MPHILQISFYVDPRGRAPQELMVAWHSLPDVAHAAAGEGTRITVIQASNVEGRLERDGVEFHFIAPDRKGSLLTRSARFAALLGALDPDVVHVHGLGFALEVIGLRRLAPLTPLLLQDHANRPPRFWRRGPWKRAAFLSQGIAFCARAQADPFRRLGLLPDHMEIFEIPESTSTFRPGEPAAARAATGVQGDPALLWVGHLDGNKDPLTVLEGVSLAMHDLPALTLRCCFASAPLLGAVEARIRHDPLLRERVKLIGMVPHARVEELMRASDLFVLGSHREGSGYSVIEALACGLPPVVTDIPSFRTLVGQGARAGGLLWPCGDSHVLAAAIRDAATRLPQLRAAARARFEREISSEALGRKLRAAYVRLAAAQPERMRA
jgi:glycosyltransferase involved in cell wall biosynthesis